MAEYLDKVSDAIKQYERLVRMIEQKEVRQRNALADTQLQLAGARNAMEAAKKAK